MLVAQTLFYLREYFFPFGCGGCGQALFGPEDAYYGLCGNCRAFFSTALDSEKRCEICGKPLISEKHTCLSCRQKEADGEKAYLVKTRTLFPYTGMFRAILGAYKFGKSLGVAHFLVERLRAIAKDLGTEKALWVPVPPRPGKIRKQGWDQIEHLAALLESGHKHSPVYRCLRRLPSRSQKELNREQRGSNLKGRIVLTKKAPPTAILFDDIITTGATLNACAQALVEAGAEKVYGVCLFYD